MANAPFYIGVGDVHGETRMIERIPQVTEAAAVIVSGDLTNHGGAEDAEAVLAAIRRVNPTVYAQLGNMDTPAVDRRLSEAGVNIHRAARPLPGGDVVSANPGVMGVGMSSPTPFGTPSEVPDEQLARWLEETHAAAEAFRPLLVVSHTPPLNTATDKLPGGAHVGSAAVRAFLERTQPDVCLTGHIHEAAALDILGACTVVNPGMLSHGGYALLTLTPQGLCAELRRA